MKMDACCTDKARVAAYFVGIVGSFLIVTGLVWALRYYTRPAPVDTARIQERLRFSQEILQAGEAQLDTIGFVDPAKEQVRLPIQRAMEMLVQEWKNPEAGRSNLLARLKHFNPPPPPKAPEKPSQFE